MQEKPIKVSRKWIYTKKIIEYQFKTLSNEEQSLKLSQDISIPYMRKEREQLWPDISHPDL